jgi:hypothetical protein
VRAPEVGPTRRSPRQERGERHTREACMTWEEMLERRIYMALPDTRTMVDTVAKKAIAEEIIERLRPYDGLKVVIDDEPVYPWWLEKGAAGEGERA